MAFNFSQEASATIGTTERSLPANTTSGVPTSQADTCQVQLWLKVNSMAAGDEFLVQLYEKTLSAGSQVIWSSWRLVHPVDKLILPAFIVHVAWDLTIKKITGTDRAVEWSLRKVT